MAPTVEVTRLASALGAEVRGVDLSSLDEGTHATVSELLLEHLVLFFPDQDMTVDQHIALGRMFGPIAEHPNIKNPFTDNPFIFELAASMGMTADEWHTDLTFQDTPSVLSILRMVECPDVGGDTMWSNLYLAYDSLSEPMKELCDGLTALHDAHPHGRPEQTAIHPVVRVHPETGKRVLYVNEHFTRRIVEMDHTESEALLTMLTERASDERFTVRYRWSPGTFAMWDNRCTQHYVCNDFEGERIIQRVTVTGDVVEGNPPKWEPMVKRSDATGRFDRQLSNHLRSAASH
jgi:taurine dioxygenase